MNLFGSGSKGHRSPERSVADMVREHQTNPAAVGQEADNQREILRARRTAAGNEIKAQQRRV